MFHRNSRTGKIILAWHIAYLVFLKGGPQGWQDWVCIQTHTGVWAERLWAAVPTEEQSLKPAPLLPQLRRVEMRGCQVLRGAARSDCLFPTSSSYLCRVSHGAVRLKPGWQWATGLSTSQWHVKLGRCKPGQYLTYRRVSVIFRMRFVNYYLHVVLYCVRKCVRAVLECWRQPFPWEDTMWWQNWTKSSNNITWELSQQLGCAAPQQNSGPWGLLSFIPLLFWYVQLHMLSVDLEFFHHS